MAVISTNIAGGGGGRFPLKKPGNGQSAPAADLEATVDFSLVADPATGTLSLTIIERNASPDEAKQLVGTTKKGNRYLKVPKGKTVKLTFALSGPWDWTFRGDGVTLDSDSHYERYWLVDEKPKKSRSIVVLPSNKNPVMDDEDPVNDEKFNLEVDIKQAKGSPLSIIIDPITKNPPPGGGFTPVGEPGPLL
jgi:hypothetical protein